MAQSCREDASWTSAVANILLEDGTLGVQEGDGDNNSFSLGMDQRIQSLNGNKMIFQPLVTSTFLKWWFLLTLSSGKVSTNRFYKINILWASKPCLWVRCCHREFCNTGLQWSGYDTTCEINIHSTESIPDSFWRSSTRSDPFMHVLHTTFSKLYTFAIFWVWRCCIRFPNLKMEAVCSYGTLVTTYKTTQWQRTQTLLNIFEYVDHA
jgi:hypothetical protein